MLEGYISDDLSANLRLRSDRFSYRGPEGTAVITSYSIHYTKLYDTRIYAEHKLKLSAYYADLRNEIYYHASSWTNTNIDQSHKYGIDLSDQWLISVITSYSIHYTKLYDTRDARPRGRIPLRRAQER